MSLLPPNIFSPNKSISSLPPLLLCSSSLNTHPFLLSPGTLTNRRQPLLHTKTLITNRRQPFPHLRKP
ncbi:hypothetical protein HanIR_Chr06g0277101 [Helianthus annuus]|nr:hypothetical protein HanIR_Chr06g0277101 [Helianthus annuus]